MIGSMAGGVRAFFILTATLLILFLPTGTLDARVQPSLTASRQSVTVEIGGTTMVALDAMAVPDKARIHVSADPGIVWSLRRTAARRWNLRIGPRPGLSSDATLSVQLLVGSKRSVATTQVKLTPKARPTLESMAQVELILDGGGLVEGREGKALIAVTNKSDQAIAIRGIEPVPSDGLATKVEDGASVVKPRETVLRLLSIDLESGSVPRAGPHLLAARVTLTTDLQPAEVLAAGRSAGIPGWEARALVSKEVTVSVPGVSELQGVLQIPTLLLLPGLLAVVCFTAVLDLARPRPAGESPFSRLAIALTPGLWIIVIMVSGVIGVAYALLAGRDILYGLGVADVVWLWFASLVLGGIVGWIAYAREKRRRRAAAAPRFVAGISPPTFLRQLVSEGVSLKRRARVSGEQLLFDLGEGAEAKEVWASGAIAMRATGATSRDMAAIRGAVDDASRVTLLLDLVGTGRLALEWRPFALGAVHVDVPRIVSTDLFTDVIREDSILQEAA